MNKLLLLLKQYDQCWVLNTFWKSQKLILCKKNQSVLIAKISSRKTQKIANLQKQPPTKILCHMVFCLTIKFVWRFTMTKKYFFRTFCIIMLSDIFYFPLLLTLLTDCWRSTLDHWCFREFKKAHSVCHCIDGTSTYRWRNERWKCWAQREYKKNSSGPSKSKLIKSKYLVYFTVSL